eukprot:2909785-Prymnesium_polylepis.1
MSSAALAVTGAASALPATSSTPSISTSVASRRSTTLVGDDRYLSRLPAAPCVRTDHGSTAQADRKGVGSDARQHGVWVDECSGWGLRFQAGHRADWCVSVGFAQGRSA